MASQAVKAIRANRQRRAANGDLPRQRNARRRRARRSRRGNGDGGRGTMIVAPVSQPVTRTACVSTSPGGPRTETGTEYLVTLRSNSTTIGKYECGSFSLNPTEKFTFPRLANVASQFLKYRCNSIRFTYTPIVATSSPGEMALVVVADPTITNPSSMEEMVSYVGAYRGPIWQATQLEVPRESFNSMFNDHAIKQIGGDPGNPTNDSLLYSPGRLMVATSGCTALSVICGEITVTYSYTFWDPRLNLAVVTSTLTVAGQPGLDQASGLLLPISQNGNYFYYRKRFLGAIRVFVTTKVLATDFNCVYEGVMCPEEETISAGTSRLAVFTIPNGRGIVVLESTAGWNGVVIRAHEV